MEGVTRDQPFGASRRVTGTAGNTLKENRTVREDVRRALANRTRWSTEGLKVGGPTGRNDEEDALNRCGATDGHR